MEITSGDRQARGNAGELPKLTTCPGPVPYVRLTPLYHSLIFVEIDADEDVVRVRTCEDRDVMKFGLATLGTTRPGGPAIRATPYTPNPHTITVPVNL